MIIYETFNISLQNFISFAATFSFAPCPLWANEVFVLVPEYLGLSAGQMESNRGLGTSLNGSVE